jgi:hypothetical protein
MAVAEFPISAESCTARLTNRLTFSQVLEEEYAPVRAGGLTVEFVHEEGEFVALEPVTGMFGEGETEMDAFSDLLSALGEMRDQLTAEEDVLTVRLANRLDFLRSL